MTVHPLTQLHRLFVMSTETSVPTRWLPQRPHGDATYCLRQPGFLKVGFTTHIRRRVKASVLNPFDLDILGLVVGDVEVETHELLVEALVRRVGERDWFEDTPVSRLLLFEAGLIWRIEGSVASRLRIESSTRAQALAAKIESRRLEREELDDRERRCDEWLRQLLADEPRTPSYLASAGEPRGFSMRQICRSAARLQVERFTELSPGTRRLVSTGRVVSASVPHVVWRLPAAETP